MRRFLLAFCLLLAGPAAAEPALWHIDAPHGRVYLFGTVHILPKGSQWFSPHAQAAFDASGTLWEEADIGMSDPARAARIMAKAPDPDFDLWSTLKDPQARKFREQLRHCGLDGSIVAHVHVWMSIMMVDVCQAMAENSGGLAPVGEGPEGTLQSRAEAGHKTIRYFETADQQIGIFADESQAVQLAQLRKAIDEAGSGKDSFGDIATAWLRGDTAAIAKVVADAKADDPALFAVLFTQRNQRFAAGITAMLAQGGTHFVAIGAGHLSGPSSVPDLLAAQGVRVSRDGQPAPAPRSSSAPRQP